jgi:hypothetical protein
MSDEREQLARELERAKSELAAYDQVLSLVRPLMGADPAITLAKALDRLGYDCVRDGRRLEIWRRQ